MQGGDQVNRGIIVWMVVASFFVYLFFFNPTDYGYGESEKVKMQVVVVNATFTPAHHWCTVPSQYCYFMDSYVPDTYRTEFICHGKKVLSYDRGIYNSSVNRINQQVEAQVNKTEVIKHYLIFPDSRDYKYSIVELL